MAQGTVSHDRPWYRERVASSQRGRVVRQDVCRRPRDARIHHDRRPRLCGRRRLVREAGRQKVGETR
eukprot:3413590-Prymnesium_polylepis.1